MQHDLDMFWYISIGYKLAFLLFGVFLTFKTRRFPPLFNDSKPIGICVRGALCLVFSEPGRLTVVWSLKDLHHSSDSHLAHPMRHRSQRLLKCHLHVTERGCHPALYHG